MKTFPNINDALKHFGINLLTGEACAYAQRLLCDVSEAGKELVLTFMGMPLDTKLNANWNSMVGDHEAVASVMLHRDMLHPLVVFAGLHVLHSNVVVTHVTGVVYFFDQDDPTLAVALDVAGRQEGYTVVRNFNTVYRDRNTHAFTGRTE